MGMTDIYRLMAKRAISQQDRLDTRLHPVYICLQYLMKSISRSTRPIVIRTEVVNTNFLCFVWSRLLNLNSSLS